MKKFNFDNSFDEIICILDASGSMECKKSGIIEGFNSFLKSQKSIKRPRKAFFSLVQFNSIYSYNNFQCVNNKNNIIPIYNRVSLNEVKPLNKESYKCDGCTPLYDTVGEVISKSSNILLETKEKPHSVLIVIITDGEENSSVNWKGYQVKNIIDQKKELGWNFMFIGSNQECFKDSNELGLNKFFVSTQDSVSGFKDSWAVVNNAATFCCNCTNGTFTFDEFNAIINQ